MLFQLGLLTLGACALLWPAYRNGFPLMFQDSAWYLSPFAGSGGLHPGRTIGYSHRGIALLTPSLWSILVAQALVTSALVVRVAGVSAKTPRNQIAVPVAALLAILLLSGAAKCVSWLMADVTRSYGGPLADVCTSISPARVAPRFTSGQVHARWQKRL